jgi:hypothetical protein
MHACCFPFDCRYSLGSSSGVERFNIDPWSGVITTATPLDYEDRSVYNLIVMATDCGLNPLTGTASLRVSVVDLNDHTPRFTKNSYSVQLYRSLNAGDDQREPYRCFLGHLAGSMIAPCMRSSGIADNIT